VLSVTFVFDPASTVNFRSDSLPNDDTTLETTRAGTISNVLDRVTAKLWSATSFPESTHSAFVNSTELTLADETISPIFSYQIVLAVTANLNS
jgi:hypothetical protein